MILRIFACCLLLACFGCTGLKLSPKYQLTDGPYEFRQAPSHYQKVGVYVAADSVRMFAKDQTQTPLYPNPKQEELFLKRSFDVDVMTVPFKFRPVTAGLPRQLTTDFNGDVFVGYRLDRFKISTKETPVGMKKHYAHRALSVGGFGGFGSTAVSPYTTTNLITEEYSGLILSRGVAVMFGVNNLTVGIGIGWDYLTDRDRSVWIYQNKAWYGLTLGLNLN